VLLDWSDYTGGVTADAPNGVADSATEAAPDASRTGDASRAGDASAAVDASPAVDARDAGPSDDEDATPPVVCNLATCPTNTCDITVYFRACCIPDGGCGCQSTIPSLGPCMAP
jgi:hypothetical protein